MKALLGESFEPILAAPHMLSTDGWRSSQLYEGDCYSLHIPDQLRAQRA